MAIDTAARRFSMMNFGTQPIFPLFIPDGTVDDGDRLHLLTLYSGIALSSVSPPVFSGILSDLEVRSSSKVIDYSGYFTNATSYSISPALESGWSLDTSTGVLTIDATTIGEYGSYIITGTNSGGDGSSNAFYIRVIAGNTGGNYGGGKDYEAELALLLEKEKKSLLSKKKSLKKKEVTLEVKADKTQDIRQKKETRLKLLKVSESLLQIEKDLVEITRKRAKIKKKARILRDDEEVMKFLMKNGYV